MKSKLIWSLAVLTAIIVTAAAQQHSLLKELEAVSAASQESGQHKAAGAQGPKQIHTWTVVITGDLYYDYGAASASGLVVDVVSASANAPKIVHNQNLGEALNILREAGGTVFQHSGFFGYTITGPMN